MLIKKINGVHQNFDPNKILKRIRDQSVNLKVDAELVFKKTINGVVDGMSTTDIDILIANSAAELITEHPDYSNLASSIIITRQGKLIGKKPRETDFLYDFFNIKSFLYKYSNRNKEGVAIELPHMMYDRVANFFAKNKEEAKLFSDFFSQRRGTGATPFLINGGTGNNNFISCFVKDTQVLTKNGFKNIQDCTRNDEVITHTNKFKKILNIFKNKRLDRDLYNIKVYGTPIITATENHKFLSYNSKLQSLGKNPEFIELKNIRVGDFIKSVSDETLKINSEIIKISNYIDIINKDWRTYKATLTTKIIDIESVETENEFQYNVTYENKRGTHLMKKYHSSIKQFEITPEFAKFIGLYYGDGNLLKTKQQGIVGINITCATKAQNIVEFVQYISKKYFNIEPKIYNSYSKDGRSWVKCSIHSRILGILFKELFGEYFDKKKIYRGIYDWDKKLLDGLLAGLISSDGNVTKKGDVRFQIANPTLVKELFGIFKKGGYDTRLSIATQYNDKLNGDKRATQYRLDFGAQNELLQYITKSYNDDRLEKIYNAKQRFIIKIGNDTFYRVQSISQSNNIDEFVYDIEVEDDHSYCVEGLIVHNCNLTTLEDDSLEGIEATLTDLAKSSSKGAGIGLHIHNLRSEKTLVSTFKGLAGGVVRFCDMVQSKMRFYKQGNRSGSAAVYLGIWHKDIIEFLSLSLQIGDEKRRTRDLFTAVCIPDLFYELLTESISTGEDKIWYTFCPHDILMSGKKPLHETWGDEFKKLYYEYVELGLGTPISLKSIWDLLLRSQPESGKPYVFNWDNANKSNNQKHLGIITGSNLCVSKDTQILTRDGYICIGELENENVDMWNGSQWSNVLVRKTGENQKLLRVITNSGYELDCTDYHKFYIQKGYSKGTGEKKLEILEVRAKDLKIGDKLIKFDLPLIEGSLTLNNAYENGFYTGDGCLTLQGQRIYLYGEKKKLVGNFKSVSNWYNQSDQDRIYGHSSVLKDKFFVPDCEYSIESRLNWLAGYLDADGTVTNNNGSQSIQVVCIEKNFLKEVQLMLQTLGCDSKITLALDEGERLLPKNDGSGELQLYSCKETNRLLINGNSLYKLSQLGLKCDRLKWVITKPNRECSQFIKIQSVNELEGLHDTYCVNEPINHKAMFNGILTGNCIEITEVTKPQYTAQCALASINLARNLSLPEIAEAAKILCRFLNRGLDKHEWSTPSAKKAGMQQRALAIGIAGLADHLAIKGIAYEDSIEYQGLIIETIYKAAIEESHRIAIEEGIVFDTWENSIYNLGGTQGDISFSNYPVANSLFVGLMPTASTSALLGVNESFEAFSSNLFVRQIDTGEFTIINKHLVFDLEKRGLWNSTIREQIIQDSGSVQDIDIPDDLKKIYKTIWEIKPRILLDCAIARQKYVDQSQSLNMYYSEPKASTMTTSLLYAWKNGLKTGVYYTRTRPSLVKPKRLGKSQENQERQKDNQVNQISQTNQKPQTSTMISPSWEIFCEGCTT